MMGFVEPCLEWLDLMLLVYSFFFLSLEAVFKIEILVHNADDGVDIDVCREALGKLDKSCQFTRRISAVHRLMLGRPIRSLRVY